MGIEGASPWARPCAEHIPRVISVFTVILREVPLTLFFPLCGSCSVDVLDTAHHILGFKWVHDVCRVEWMDGWMAKRR